MLHCMKTTIDDYSPEVTAKAKGVEAFFDLAGVGSCPYMDGSIYKAHWLAGWLEGFSGKGIEVHMATNANR